MFFKSLNRNGRYTVNIQHFFSLDLVGAQHRNLWWDARHDAVSPGKDLRTMRCPLQAWMCCHNNAGLVAARGDIETVQKRKELPQKQIKKKKKA